ncbi:DUF342 domain-containing protein [Paraglaciecola chathamensis]|uniref:DUF342 domain-containing protein n=1 Tax=Paraglaciecola chathamensis TaxID=368405 RepID=UPI002703CEDD|nr:FapA family protein [Paraglaciecola chathamensis]MDO6559545.1 FapA family protein [Paraglaciecola chathamensis]
MQGVTLKLDESGTHLSVHISPLELSGKIDIDLVQNAIKQSEFADFYIHDDAILTLLENTQKAIKTESSEAVIERVGERKGNEIKCKVDDGQLSATMTIIKGYGAATLTLDDLYRQAKNHKIVRGVSSKRLAALLQSYLSALAGESVSSIIAKGLPPKTGRSSKLQPLVQNALDRILRPQSSHHGRVDMRNLGDIICVKVGTELLRRLPPSRGRAGYTVTGETITPKAGEWLKLRPGDGTAISEKDENILIAEISGMPKFKDQKMWVDDTYICKGVNVGTGNVNYDGAVLVNGDITEKMEVYATGDVTVNGFVESAIIHAGGDIIITEGAMGKVNDAGTEYSTTLRAKGSIHIQHGQGLDIKCDGGVTIGRQLAFSKVVCRKEMVVGPIDKPNGNLFACSIFSQNRVQAGTFGAVSGSNLTLDFSDGFNTLLARKDSLDELVRQIRQNCSRHEDRMKIIRSKFIPEDLQGKVDAAQELFENEHQLMQWLEQKALELAANKENYQQQIVVSANKRIYPGVVIKLNNRTWRAEREYGKANISFHGHQWQCDAST